MGREEKPFRLRSLIEPYDEDAVYPPTVQLWGWATSAALMTGMISGLLRGARMGYARGMAACKMQGIEAQYQKSLVRSYMHAEMAKTSLSQGGRLGLFVALLMGVDVLALEYKSIAGPMAPAIGGGLAAAVLTARKGPTVFAASVGLGAGMGLAFGTMRWGLGDWYKEAIDAIFPEPPPHNKD